MQEPGCCPACGPSGCADVRGSSGPGACPVARRFESLIKAAQIPRGLRTLTLPGELKCYGVPFEDAEKLMCFIKDSHGVITISGASSVSKSLLAANILIQRIIIGSRNSSYPGGRFAYTSEIFNRLRVERRGKR